MGVKTFTPQCVPPTLTLPRKGGLACVHIVFFQCFEPLSDAMYGKFKLNRTVNGGESNREPCYIVKKVGSDHVFWLDRMESRVILYLPALIRED